jgi:uncharacterized protein YcbK (DUF882 family)
VTRAQRMMAARVNRAMRRVNVHPVTEAAFVHQKVQEHTRQHFGFNLDDLKKAHREGSNGQAQGAARKSPHAQGTAMDYFWLAGHDGKTWEQTVGGN